MRSGRLLLWAAVIGLVVGSGSAWALLPFTYQGQLKQNGLPCSGLADMRFSLYDSEQGGTLLGSETIEYVSLTNGLFTVELNAFGQFPLSVFDGSPRWIEVAVRYPADGESYTTLSPRQQLAATPYAYYALRPWARSGSNLSYVDGNVGIGTSSPTARLEIGGTPGSDGIKFPDGTIQTTAATSGSAGWSLTGNAGTDPATHFIGTTDNQPLEVRVKNTRVLRVEPIIGHTYTGIAPNWIAGAAINSVTPGYGFCGATIAGGGGWGVEGEPLPNTVTGRFGTIGGGLNNQVDWYGTIGGGERNKAPGQAGWVTIGGGYSNTASSHHATVGGGIGNTAEGSSANIAGGGGNRASGICATVPGGDQNWAGGDFSLAAGRWARVRTAAQVGNGDTNGDEGTFVWADSPAAPQLFTSTGPNQFLIRASGGVGINTDAPEESLSVAGTFKVDQDDTNTGTSASIKFGKGLTGEGIGSKRSLGGNWAGLDFYTANVNRMCITNAGYVGISTSSPGSKLTVVGIIESSSGGIKFPDGTLQTTAASGGGFDLPFDGRVTSSATAFKLMNLGQGRAGQFVISFPSSENPALEGVTDGHGSAVQGTTTGRGPAGQFLISNTDSSAPAVYASSNGTGPAIRAQGVIESTSGGFQFPDGSIQTAAAGASVSAALSIDPPSLAAAGSGISTVTVPGAAVGDAVVANPGADLPAGYVIAWVRVSAANTVRIGFINGTPAALNPAASTWAIRILK